MREHPTSLSHTGSYSLRGDLDVLVDGAGLLDVGHLADVGDGAEDGGEHGAGEVSRFLAVEVALQQPCEDFLKRNRCCLHTNYDAAHIYRLF